MGKAQRDKGARGERMWAELCRANGFENVKRMGQQQYQRGSEVADCIGLDGIHQEIKNVQKLNVRRAMEQSIADSKWYELPIVAHHVNRGDWLVTMRAIDWFKLYKSWQSEMVLEY